ncbi:trace amine-associated receptor 13c-like [Sphaeramia orbicularis]|uniref:trace amine-associated receptor 13c-like n=1 Tax=Sphaeramia orbicularis TaxID=375764 RepID=UPI00117EB7C0|nr:trace amine-associated receptor 13c-like [Sphaeramia orbicularis]
METLEEAELCFPSLNNSCWKTSRSHVEATIVYTVLSCITLITVVLNLLVIISIYHFRQLHTTTNLLLLSLAVSDFLVGLLQMPFQIFHYRGCWILGDFACVVYYFSAFLVVSVSVGNMVLISIDRYVAICDPMLYPTKVTPRRVQICIYMCWIFSTIHASWILRDLLKQPGRYNTCHGECVLVVNFAEGVFDLIVTFLAPFLIITVLYMRVFVVAVSQARAMRSHVATVSQQHSGTVTAQKSELKAAKTLGILVVVFILCSCPYYCFTVAAETNLVGASSADVELWLIYFNSCLNPLIYAFCYPWFRKSIKHIVTLKILQPDSRDTNIL